MTFSLSDRACRGTNLKNIIGGIIENENMFLFEDKNVACERPKLRLRFAFRQFHVYFKPTNNQLTNQNEFNRH